MLFITTRMYVLYIPLLALLQVLDKATVIKERYTQYAHYVVIDTDVSSAQNMFGSVILLVIATFFASLF